MKFLYIIPLAFLLVSCASVTPNTGIATPVQVPDLPNSLAQKATQLPPLTDLTFGGIIQDNANTTRKYNEVGSQMNALIDLYNCVKVSMNEKKNPNDICF